MSHDGENFVWISDGTSRVRLSRLRAGLLLYEWSIWESHYAPTFGVAGKTVLDIGAGDGETAFFYFSKGAGRVICVEPDEARAGLLRQNVERNHWNCQVLSERFSPAHLSLPFDFCKMDCEGCESSLLALDRLPPIVVEVHDEAVKTALLARFGMHVAHAGASTWLLTNLAAPD